LTRCAGIPKRHQRGAAVPKTAAYLLSVVTGNFTRTRNITVEKGSYLDENVPDTTQGQRARQVEDKAAVESLLLTHKSYKGTCFLPEAHAILVVDGQLLPKLPHFGLLLRVLCKQAGEVSLWFGGSGPGCDRCEGKVSHKARHYKLEHHRQADSSVELPAHCRPHGAWCVVLLKCLLLHHQDRL